MWPESFFSLIFLILMATVVWNCDKIVAFASRRKLAERGNF